MRRGFLRWLSKTTIPCPQTNHSSTESSSLVAGRPKSIQHSCVICKTLLITWRRSITPVQRLYILEMGSSPRRPVELVQKKRNRSNLKLAHVSAGLPVISTGLLRRHCFPFSCFTHLSFSESTFAFLSCRWHGSDCCISSSPCAFMEEFVCSLYPQNLGGTSVISLPQSTSQETPCGSSFEGFHSAVPLS